MDSILSVTAQNAARVAVRDREREWTYAGLENLVAGLTAGLQREGFGPQTLLAVALPHRVEQLAVHLAAFRLGIPLVRLDASYAPPQLAYCLRLTQPRGMITDQSLAGVLAKTEIPHSVASIWMVGGGVEASRDFAELLETPGVPAAEAVVSDLEPAALATITFTSGTTARPRGVVHTRQAVEAALTRNRGLLQPTAEDVVLVRAPLHSQVGLLIQSLPTLAVGGQIELHSEKEVDAYVAALRRGPAKTVIADNPSMLLKLFRHPHVTTVELERLRWILSGGDWVSRRLRTLVHEITGRDVAVIYGLTEVGLVSCRGKSTPDQSPMSVGRPLPDTAISIRDGAGDAVPPGASGQIWVRTSSQMSEYWQAPELTGTVMTTDGWIATGDVGSWCPTGELILEGRQKDMMVRGAYKVSPLEVEAVLLLHPAVQEVGVTGVTLTTSEGDNQEILACVVLRDGFEPRPSEADLRQLAAERLSALMVPDRVRFVRRLPLHPTGKLDRGRLWVLAEADDLDSLSV